jgi:hypothetical protein
MPVKPLSFFGQLANRGRAARSFGNAKRWEGVAKSSLPKTGSPTHSQVGQQRFADASKKYEEAAGKYNQQMGDWENYLSTLSAPKRWGARAAGRMVGTAYDFPRLATFSPYSATGLLGSVGFHAGIPIATSVALGKEFNPDIFSRISGGAHAVTRGKADAAAGAQQGAADMKNALYNMYFNGSTADRRALLGGGLTSGILSGLSQGQRMGLRSGNYRPTQGAVGSTFWGSYTPEMYFDQSLSKIAPMIPGMTKSARLNTASQQIGRFAHHVMLRTPKSLPGQVDTAVQPGFLGGIKKNYRKLPERTRRNINRTVAYGIPTAGVGAALYFGYRNSKDSATQGGYQAGQMGALQAAQNKFEGLGMFERELATYFPNLAYNLSQGRGITPSAAPKHNFSYTPSMYYRPNGEPVYMGRPQ